MVAAKGLEMDPFLDTSQPRKPREYVGRDFIETRRILGEGAMAVGIISLRAHPIAKNHFELFTEGRTRSFRNIPAD